MAGRTGSYFVNIFAESKRYLGNLLQQGKPLVDGDWNDQSENEQKLTQRPFQKMGDRFYSDSFKILGQGSGSYSGPDTFKIDGLSGSIGDPETWGWGWIGGLPVRLTDDWLYWNDATGSSFVAYTDQHLDEMFHRSYNLQDLGSNIWRVTDTSVAYKAGELVGRTIYPNAKDNSVSGAPDGYTIVANTANTIDFDTTTGASTTPPASAGDYYIIGLTTPAPTTTRDDEIYLDIHIEEWNGTEDSDLIMPIGPGIECMRRLKLVQLVHVIEDVSTHGSMPANYVDVDGNQHYTVLLASMTRDDTGNIPDSILTDERDPWFGSGPEVETARGLMNQLEERIYRTYDPGTGLPVTDGVILPDGTLNPLAVGAAIDHDDLADMPDTAGSPALANSDHDARYGDVTYSSGPAGGPNDSVVDAESHRDAINRLDQNKARLHGQLQDAAWNAVTDHDARYGGLTYSGETPSAASPGNDVVADNDSHGEAIKALDSAVGDLQENNRPNFVSAFEQLFGDAGAGNLVVSSDTDLGAVQAVEYDNLTINSGFELTADGPWLHIAVKDTLTIQTGGRIHLRGADGGDGPAGATPGAGAIGKGSDGGDGAGGGLQSKGGLSESPFGKAGNDADGTTAIGNGGSAFGYGLVFSGGGGSGGSDNSASGGGGAGGGAGANGITGGVDLDGLDGESALGTDFETTTPIFDKTTGRVIASKQFRDTTVASFPLTVNKGDILWVIGNANAGYYTVDYATGNDVYINETFPSTGTTGERYLIFRRSQEMTLTQLKGLHRFVISGGHLGIGGGGSGGASSLPGNGCGGGGAGGGGIYIEAKNVVFPTGYLLTGSTGSCLANAIFQDLSATFQTNKVKRGDILEIYTASPADDNVAKYRVIDVVSETQLFVECDFKTVTSGVEDWRIIPMAIDASGGNGGDGFPTVPGNFGGGGGGGGGTVFIVADSLTTVDAERVGVFGGASKTRVAADVIGGYGGNGMKAILDLSNYDG